jgi:hypothetical protein
MNKFFILILCSSLFLVACNQQPEEAINMKKVAPNMSLETLGAKGYNEIIGKITSALEKAKSVGGVWRDAGKMLKHSKSLSGSGRYDDAIKSAKTVLFQAKRGYEQALSQKNVGNPNYLY